MFSDEAQIKFISGKGGDGLVSWRREKFVPKGGPDGGDGGKGGDVILVVNSNLNTLSKFHSKKVFQAQNGERGKSRKKHGKNGENLFIELPTGTEVFQEDKKIADLSSKDSEFVVVRGGRGGFGNAHFVSSIRQAPSFAELGEEPEKKELRLELKLVADVAIIGYPSVGKSTFISRVSNCKPKIAEYHFTTIVPNLGVANAGDEDLVLVDVPGLIKDAHQGKGLGIKFLKHTERARVLLHILDISRNPEDDFQMINSELKKFSQDLSQKKQILALNKVDIFPSEKVLKIKKDLEKTLNKKIFSISAVSGEGVKEVIFELNKLNKKEKSKEVKEETFVEFYPHLEDPRSFWVEKEEDGFRIFGKRILQIAAMTDFNNEEALFRLRDVIKKLGIDKEIIRLGGSTEKLLLNDKVLDL